MRDVSVSVRGCEGYERARPHHQVCYEEALDWSKNRVAFGSTLSNFQASQCQV